VAAKRILAISGSLREQSSNTALMYAIMGMAKDELDFTVYGGLGDLPHFNPEIDIDEGPPSVMKLRALLKEADGVFFCTPEYAKGVPGVLKNALDWIVSSGEFMFKPVAVVSASPTPMGGDKAHASLLLTLGMMDAKIVAGGTMIIPFITLKLKNGVITDSETASSVLSLLNALTQAVNEK
jgi:chromate reductase